MTAQSPPLTDGWSSDCAFSWCFVIAAVVPRPDPGRTDPKPIRRPKIQAAQPASTADLRVLTLPSRTDGPKASTPQKHATYDNQACSQIFDCLVQFTNTSIRPLELEPAIVTAMPTITDNIDGTQTWAFELRDDVYFQDDPCFPGAKGVAWCRATSSTREASRRPGIPVGELVDHRRTDRPGSTTTRTARERVENKQKFDYDARCRAADHRRPALRVV